MNPDELLYQEYPTLRPAPLTADPKDTSVAPHQKMPPPPQVPRLEPDITARKLGEWGIIPPTSKKPAEYSNIPGTE